MRTTGPRGAKPPPREPTGRGPRAPPARLTSLDQSGQGESEADEERRAPDHHGWELAEGPRRSAVSARVPEGEVGEALGRRRRRSPAATAGPRPEPARAAQPREGGGGARTSTGAGGAPGWGQVRWGGAATVARGAERACSLRGPAAARGAGPQPGGRSLAWGRAGARGAGPVGSRRVGRPGLGREPAPSPQSSRGEPAVPEQCVNSGRGAGGAGGQSVR